MRFLRILSLVDFTHLFLKISVTYLLELLTMQRSEELMQLHREWYNTCFGFPSLLKEEFSLGHGLEQSLRELHFS